ERGAVFAAGKFAPAIAQDFAVDRRTHVADHVRSHDFLQNSNASIPKCAKNVPKASRKHTRLGWTRNDAQEASRLRRRGCPNKEQTPRRDTHGGHMQTFYERHI